MKRTRSVRRATAILAMACPCAAAVAFGGDDLHLSLLTDDLTRPVWVGSAPGDIDRLFIVDQHDQVDTGWVRVFRGGTLLPTPFLTLSPVAIQDSNGVLCLAFAPDYVSSGVFYLLHTDAVGTVFVARYLVSANPEVADPASRDVILSIPQPHHFHQGGWMAFGPDGYLYLSSGDGGPGGDPDQRGQDTQSLLGKMLRIDPGGDDFPGDDDRDYAIPPSNPFVGEAPLDEIWALGVREPWRCSFDRLTGDLYLADVGQEEYEEINVQPASSPGGENYGWRCREGAHDNMADPECVGATFVEPLFEDPIAGNPQCAIIGGYVYRGAGAPALTGRYFFADHCSNRIRSLSYDGAALLDLLEHATIVDDPPGAPLVATLGPITSFGEDLCGELYLTDLTGQLFKVAPAAPITDCNGNDVEDACETAADPARDVDGNSVPDTCECLADADASGTVGIVDLLDVLKQWGPCPVACPADSDADDEVGILDFLRVLSDWGPCP